MDGKKVMLAGREVCLLEDSGMVTIVADRLEYRCTPEEAIKFARQVIEFARPHALVGFDEGEVDDG